MVQCGFCGLKWKQFPVEQIKKTQSVTRSQKTVASPTVQPKIKKTKNIISKTKETKKSKRKKSKSLRSQNFLLNLTKKLIIELLILLIIKQKKLRKI